MVDWNVFSYLGLGFAVIYRIPQIVRIVRTKKADDLSSYSYLTHNGAYLSFIAYLVGTGKTSTEWVLSFYYFMGISQNLLIFALKKYYARQERKRATAERRAREPSIPEPDDATLVDISAEPASPDERARIFEDAVAPHAWPRADGPANCRVTYARRRRWYMERNCQPSSTSSADS
jgi:uncharacterized protein with PQ loop repeat